MADTLTMSQRADALEEKMARELDVIVVKSRLHMLADGDTSPPPNGGRCNEPGPPRPRSITGGAGRSDAPLSR